MKPHALVLFTAAGLVAVNAAAGTRAIRSFSGQFIAHETQPAGAVVMPPDLLTNVNALELKPELLAVSAERVKQALWMELGAHPTWRDNIHLSLRPARSAADLVDVRLERFQYRQDLVNYEKLDPPAVRAVPLGEGFLDLEAFFAGLNEGGFNGYVAYEMCSPLRGGGSEANLDAAARKSLDVIRRLTN